MPVGQLEPAPELTFCHGSPRIHLFRGCHEPGSSLDGLEDFLLPVEGGKAHDSEVSSGAPDLESRERVWPPSDEALIEQATQEVDLSLLDWYQELSLRERLRAASRSAALYGRLRNAVPEDR